MMASVPLAEGYACRCNLCSTLQVKIANVVIIGLEMLGKLLGVFHSTRAA